MNVVKRLYLGLGLVGVALGCNAALGLGDFSFDATDAGTGDTFVPGEGGSGDGGGDACAVDLTKQCYACTPNNTEQFLNSCADGTNCLQFDRARLTSLLLPDGALPPLPAIVDAGGQ